MSSSFVTKTQFKIDTKEKWNILNGYVLEPSSPKNAIPKTGELFFVLGQENLQIYCGISNEIKWEDSLILFDAPKNDSLVFLKYFDKTNTEEKLTNDDTFIWNLEKNDFELASVLSLTFRANDISKGALFWNNELQEWKIDTDYTVINNEYNGGIYNKNLSEPSFANQSLSFDAVN